jgi:hypothetical protein
MDSERYG